MRKYWYKFFISECPVCGRSDNFKERQYSKKPKDIRERYEYRQFYDYCDL